MAGINKTDFFTRSWKSSQGQGYQTGKERKKRRAGAKQARKDKQFAAATIPDDEQIKRNERRKAAKRQGSRASTVLTNRSDQLGPAR